jgi:hypothetical protein
MLLILCVGTLKCTHQVKSSHTHWPASVSRRTVKSGLLLRVFYIATKKK